MRLFKKMWKSSGPAKTTEDFFQATFTPSEWNTFKRYRFGTTVGNHVFHEVALRGEKTPLNPKDYVILSLIYFCKEAVEDINTDAIYLFRKKFRELFIDFFEDLSEAVTTHATEFLILGGHPLISNVDQMLDRELERESREDAALKEMLRDRL